MIIDQLVGVLCKINLHIQSESPQFLAYLRAKPSNQRGNQLRHLLLAVIYESALSVAITEELCPSWSGPSHVIVEEKLYAFWPALI